MIYIYGLSLAPLDRLTDGLAGQPGIQGALGFTSIGRWTLIHSDQNEEEILPKRRLLLSHTRVLETAMKFGALLPARFGLVAAKMQHVTDIISKNDSSIVDAFAKTEDAVELGLRIKFPNDPAIRATLDEDTALNAARDRLARAGTSANFSIAAFGGMLAEQVDRRRGKAQRQLIKELSPLWRDYVLRAPESDTEVLRVECLLETAEIAQFEAAVVQAAGRLTFAGSAEPEIQLVGPVPCYNFVTLNLHFDLNQEVA